MVMCEYNKIEYHQLDVYSSASQPDVIHTCDHTVERTDCRYINKILDTQEIKIPKSMVQKLISMLDEYKGD